MDTNKSLDLAAGRLAKVSTGHGPPRPRPERASSYGASRLGITPDRQHQEGEAVEVAPAITAPPARPAPTEAKPARPRPLARRLDPAPELVAVTGVMGRLRSLNLGNLRVWVRRPGVLAAAGTMAAVAVAWFAFSGGPESPLGPQTPARAHGAVAPASPARPARLAEAKPEPVPVAPKPVVGEPAKPNPVALDGPAPPVQQLTARQGLRLSARTASLLSSWLKEAREALPHPAAPTPATKPRQPPKPEKNTVPTPPTYTYVPCPPGFRFTGAVQHPDGAFADINGRFVRVGGKVSGARVVKINGSSAVMEREGKRFVVSFGMGTPAPPRQDDGDDIRAKKPPVTTQPAPQRRDSDQATAKPLKDEPR